MREAAVLERAPVVRGLGLLQREGKMEAVLSPHMGRGSIIQALQLISFKGGEHRQPPDREEGHWPRQGQFFFDKDNAVPAGQQLCTTVRTNARKRLPEEGESGLRWKEGSE
jgi:hypothetical protein